MSSDADPPRMLDQPHDNLLGEALRGAADDLPSADRIESMLLRFPGGPGGGGGGGGGGPGGPSPGTALVKSMAAKIAAGIALGGGISALVIVAHQSVTSTPTSAAPATTASQIAPLPSATVAETTAPSAAPSSAPSTTPSAPTARPNVPAPSASAPIRTEIEMLREAQAAIASNPGRALAICNEHATSYPNGGLGQEREMIRIQALAALGRTGEARAAAEAFKARHPNSAYVQRLDEILGTK